jgi:hypothetical protein
MTAAPESKLPAASAGGAGASSHSYSDAALAAVREIGFAPLVSGFVQGFASVAVAHWRERRKTRALEAAAAKKPVDIPEGLDDLQPVFISPQ